ncbi:MAG: site-specific integrase [Eubacterium sp.]|nr:site-specific integrase [Eubacterium sp.]
MDNIKLIADLILSGATTITQLNESVKNGTILIDIPALVNEIEMREREHILKKHPNEIYQGNDGNWYTYLPDSVKGRRRIKRKHKEDLESAIIAYYREKEHSPTIKDVFDEWNDRRLRNELITPATHLRNQQTFERCYDTFGNRKIKEISCAELTDFLEDQIRIKNLSSKAFSGLKSITEGFLKRAKKRGLINFCINDFLDDLDISDVAFHKEKKEESREVFNTTELPLLIDYLSKNPDIHNLGILLMLVTGVRVGELVSLKYEDFEDETTFHVRRTETRFTDENGKYHREISSAPKTAAGVRVVYIPRSYSWILGKIRQINPCTEYLFVRNGKRMSTDAIRKRMYRICDKIGIPRRAPHACRKTCATVMLDNQIPEKVIIGQLGHTNISCTEQFYYKDRKTPKEKRALIDNIPEFEIKES